MRLKTLSWIISTVLITASIITGVLLLQINRSITAALDKDIFAEKIINEVFELNILISDYEIFHRQRSSHQILVKQKALSALLSNTDKMTPEESILLKKMNKSRENIQTLFIKMDKLLDRFDASSEELSEINEIYIGQISVQAQDIVTDAINFTSTTHSEVTNLRQKSNNIIAVLSTVLIVCGAGVFILINLVMIKPLRKFHNAIKMIAGGDLDYKVDIDSGNEIGELAKAFNKMAEKRHGAEEELKKSVVYLDVMGDALIVLNVQRELIKFNKAFTELFGYSREEAQGMSFEKIFPEKEHKRHFTEMEIAIKSGMPRFFETSVLTKDGKEIPVLLSGTALTDAQGALTGFVGVCKDISERKKAEEELNKAHKLESIGILAGGIAHDFNNLLAAIRNNIYLSMMHVDRENIAYENLELTENIIHRATNLTQQLLTFARGGTPVKKTASIIELIKESAEFVLKGSNAKCEYNIADNLWPVDVDAGQMNQVIHNLILNAVQSMPKGGTILISTENSNLGSDTGLPLQEGKYVKIIIQDQGVGITEEELKNVFDPYFTTKEMARGRGLGLSITYSIIKNHYGHISVESETGIGTTFTIYLPASEKQIEEKETVEDTSISGEGKVLIMDDEEIIRDSAGQLLTYKGYEVQCAKDGDEAIELYKKAMEASKPFDAVILDLTIRGGMGGKEAVKKLREIDPGVKAIVASGYSNDPVLSNFKEYGFCGVFAKHNKTEELSKTLHKVINGDR